MNRARTARSLAPGSCKESETSVEYALRFRVELMGVSPPIWRRIEVPYTYSLWDLHVAIQDAMGWLDSHLHMFRVVGSTANYGIPDEDGEDLFETKPDWEFTARDVFSDRDPVGTYEYDFGDGWTHLIVLEDMPPLEKGLQYPRCPAGARRCPPEDCGGPHGYMELLSAQADPSHPEHRSILEWLGGAVDPEEFDPDSVVFDNPKERWSLAFSE